MCPAVPTTTCLAGTRAPSIIQLRGPRNGPRTPPCSRLGSPGSPSPHSSLLAWLERREDGGESGDVGGKHGTEVEEQPVIEEAAEDRRPRCTETLVEILGAALRAAEGDGDRGQLHCGQGTAPDLRGRVHQHRAQ